MAQEGIRECALLSLRDDVARGNLIGAETLLLEIEDVPPDVLESVDRLRKEHQEREERDARHRARERQEDWRLAGRKRLAFFVGLSLFTVAVWLWSNQGQVRYEVQRTPTQLAIAAGVVNLALSVWRISKKIAQTPPESS